jgi:hypothetical protein
MDAADAAPPGVSPQPPPTGCDPVVFDRPAAARVVASVRWAENQYRGRDAVGKGRKGEISWLRKALTGSAIPAATAGDTPGSGTVTLCDMNPSTHKWVSNGTTVTAYTSSTAGSVAAATYVTLGWVSGVWEVILEPCP